ncbi:MAG: hypothetical protein H6686_09770 [Fibrobacteria bacterium]|nr:hypothetical protein [Fibrobacteria bacterium]
MIPFPSPARVVALMSCLWTFAAANSVCPEFDSRSKVVPATLEQAHEAFERCLGDTTLAMIDSIPEESGMALFHFGLGTAIRNRWGLWGDSPLAKDLERRGFQHPDDMSSVLIGTFWCRRHGVEFDLAARAARYARYWEEAREQEREAKRLESLAKSSIASMMVGCRTRFPATPKAAMPHRRNDGLRARYLAPFGSDVLVGVRRQERDARGFLVARYRLEPYVFSPKTRRMAVLPVPGLDTIHSLVALGDTAWISGVRKGRPTFVGITSEASFRRELPDTTAIPILGISPEEKSLLLVYDRTIFQGSPVGWAKIHSATRPWRDPGAYARASGKEPPRFYPRVCAPPQKHGNLVFFHDEGVHESGKMLWWLDLRMDSAPVAFSDAVGVVGPNGPDWRNVTSFEAAGDTGLWVFTGSLDGHSLLHRSRSGAWEVYLYNNSAVFDSSASLLSTTTRRSRQVSPFAMVTGSGKARRIIGNEGLYVLSGDRISREVSFGNTTQEIDRGDSILHWSWDPSLAMDLGGDRILVCGVFGGIYLMERNSKGLWTFLPLDDG